MQIMMDRGKTRKAVMFQRIAFAAGILVLIGAWFGHKPVLNRYKAWKQGRALDQAQGFLDQKDFTNAKLALDVALDARPGNPQAMRVAANLLEQVGAPQVMQLRRRIVMAAPDSVADRAALVMSSLRFKDLNSARDALRAMTPEQASEPVALKAALAYAEVTNNKPIANLLYGQLKAAEPDNETLQVLHALLRLKNPQPEVVAAARAELEILRENPRHARFINRDLLMNAVLQKDMVEAKQLAAILRQDPDANLSDRLHAANLALNVDNQPFETVFADIESSISESPEDVAKFTRWLIIVGQPQRAQQWLRGQTDALQTAPAVNAVKAELAATMGNWDELSNLLENGAWGSTRQDTVRLAFSARLVAARENNHLREDLWKETLHSAGGNLTELQMVYRLAAQWDWPEQAEQTLWAVARAHPAQTWAHQSLFNAFRERRQTDQMLALIATLRESDPTLPRYRYDWALLSMLSNQRPTWSPDKQAMQQLFEADSSNAFYAVGYAFALAQSKKPEEAVAVIEKMAPSDLALPARIPYLAYIYQVANQPEKVARVVASNIEFDSLLPEEVSLIEEAREYVQ
jgi:hypothetical protein